MSGATALGDADRSARWSDTTRRAGELLGGLATPDVMLGGFCTYRVGGPAAFLVEVSDDTELEQVAAVVAETGVDTLVVGRGSTSWSPIVGSTDSPSCSVRRSPGSTSHRASTATPKVTRRSRVDLNLDLNLDLKSRVMTWSSSAWVALRCCPSRRERPHVRT